MTETAALTAGKGGPGEKLGFSVSISNLSVVAGAPLARFGQGIAYLFLRPAGGWRSISSTNEISATDGTGNNYFGWSAGTGQGAVMVGAYGWPAGGLGAQGAMYVFGTGQEAKASAGETKKSRRCRLSGHCRLAPLCPSADPWPRR